MLLVEPVPAELDRLSEAFRTAGARVAAISRADAVLALTRAFRPDVAVVGLRNGEPDALRTGKRLHRRFQGRVPTIYVGDVRSPDARRMCFELGRAIGILPRSATTEELLGRVRAVLGYGNAVEVGVRRQMEETPPSLHDEMTGLYTRAFLLELVSVETRRAERHGGCFSVAIVELDDFMRYRERLGEEACERLTTYAATLLRAALRESDVLARVGRYHFGVLLPGMPVESVRVLLERIARRFDRARIDVGGRPLRPSVTLGVASFPDVVGPAEQMFARALQDLDRAREEKRSGSPRAAV